MFTACLNVIYMSKEHSLNITSIKQETPDSIDYKISNVKYKIPGKVDINNLLFKVREKEKKEKKENLVYLGLVGSVVIITGIIASL